MVLAITLIPCRGQRWETRTLIFLLLQFPQPVLVLECVFRLALRAGLLAGDPDAAVGTRGDALRGPPATAGFDPLSIISGCLVERIVDGSNPRIFVYTRVGEVYKAPPWRMWRSLGRRLAKARTSRLTSYRGRPI